MKNILDFQSKMGEIKKELEAGRIEGISSDGQVKIVIDGKLKAHSIDITESLLSSCDKEKLECAILSCINDAVKKSQEFATEKVRASTGINIPGA